MTYYFKKSEKKRNIFQHFLCTVFAFIFMLLFPYPLLPGISDVNAQDIGNETKADFLFQKPAKYIGFRIGMFSPEADSDLFNMVTEELTLEKKDFRAFDFGMELGFNIYERVDLVFNFDYSKKTNDSEFRDYVDDQGLPITQSTRFSQTPLTAGIKYLLLPRGRQISRFSWLPSPIVPYVSGGVGILWYEFRQNGDFVDYSTLDIFSATLDSSGETFTGYLGCGVDINIYRSTYINLDFRYSWADDDLDSDFVDFDPIELGGYRLTTGIQWLF